LAGLVVIGGVAFVLAILGGIAAGALTSYSSARLDDLLEKRVPEIETRRLVRRRLDADLDRDLDLAAASRLVGAAGSFTLVALAIERLIAGGHLSVASFAGAVAAILVVCELVPGIVGVALAERVVLGWAGALRRLLAPVLLLGRLAGSGRRLARRLSGEEELAPDDQIEDEVLTLVEEGRRDGVLEPEAEEMIASIFDFRDLAASNVMTPRIEMTALDANTPIEEVYGIVRKEGYSRYPVYEGTRDNIIGVLYVKDLVRVLTGGIAEGATGNGTGPALRDLVRAAYFVPETRKVDGLLAEMRRRRVHFAVVLDEYGGTAGIVTMEDIVEEVFGEIEDEFDAKAREGIVPVGSAGATDGRERPGAAAVEADGRIALRDLGDALGVELPESEEYNTLGGFVVSRMGRIPRPGERCAAAWVEVRVLAADERRVLRARVSRVDSRRTERLGARALGKG